MNNCFQGLQYLRPGKFAQESDKLRHTCFHLLQIDARVRLDQRIPDPHSSGGGFEVALPLQLLATRNRPAEQIANDGLSILDEVCRALQLLQSICQQPGIDQHTLEHLDDLVRSQRSGPKSFNRISHRVFAHQGEIGDKVLGAVTNPLEVNDLLDDKVQLAIKLGNAVIRDGAGHDCTRFPAIDISASIGNSMPRNRRFQYTQRNIIFP